MARGGSRTAIGGAGGGQRSPRFALGLIRACLLTGQYLLVVAAAAVLNFFLPRLAPGDVVDYLLPPEQAGAISPEQRQELLERYGLGDPMWVQFQQYITGLLRGDLLVSAQHGRPVADLILERLPWTLLLVGGSLLLAALIGAAAGYRSAFRRGRRSDVGTLSGFMVAESMPPFVVGLLLILIFSVTLGLFPVVGAVPMVPMDGMALVVEVARRSVLPIVSLSVLTLGTVYLIARGALIAELREDYVFFARAKGLSPRRVRLHAQRNARLPVLTVVLMNLGTVVGGATLIETIFSYPGLGLLIFESVQARDYPVLQGTFFVLAVAVVLANLTADLLYPLLDPRVRRTAGGLS